MLFKLESNMELFLRCDEAWNAVDLRPCFPNKHQDKYLAVRDSDGNELRLIEDIEQLDDISQKIIGKYLDFKMFRFEIVGVYKVEEEFGVRHFEVKTTKGLRNFQTELDGWPVQKADGTIMIDDLYGDQYMIKHLEFGENLISDFVE